MGPKVLGMGGVMPCDPFPAPTLKLAGAWDWPICLVMTLLRQWASAGKDPTSPPVTGGTRILT